MANLFKVNEPIEDVYSLPYVPDISSVFTRNECHIDLCTRGIYDETLKLCKAHKDLNDYRQASRKRHPSQSPVSSHEETLTD